MTDLELTRLCAEAMGITGHPVIESCEMWTPEGWEKNKDSLVTHSGPDQIYNPLHDDAQAMALVKKHNIDFCWKLDGEWCAGIDFLDEDGEGPPQVHNADLNRAIVECVAQMQAAKEIK